MQAKPHCVLVHGWGMPLTIFDMMIARLENQVEFTVITLPGDAQVSGLQGITAYVDFIVAQIDRPAYWLGWSFGGMLSLEVASRYPEKVLGLMLVTSTPKFVQAKDWKAGIDATVLSAFGAQLKGNYNKTLKQFLALQTLHAPNQKSLTKALQALVSTTPSLEDLTEQLELLGELDLRPILSEIQQPTLWLSGDQDTLTPSKAGEYAAKMMPHAEVIVFEKCGHLPFWTHPNQFDTQFLLWITGKRAR